MDLITCLRLLWMLSVCVDSVIGLRCKKCLWMESDDLNIQHLIDNTVDETLLVDCLDEPQNVGHEECTRDEDVCVYTIVYTTHTVYTAESFTTYSRGCQLSTGYDVPEDGVYYCHDANNFIPDVITDNFNVSEYKSSGISCLCDGDICNSWGGTETSGLPFWIPVLVTLVGLIIIGTILVIRFQQRLRALLHARKEQVDDEPPRIEITPCKDVDGDYGGGSTGSRPSVISYEHIYLTEPIHTDCKPYEALPMQQLNVYDAIKRSKAKRSLPQIPKPSLMPTLLEVQEMIDNELEDVVTSHGDESDGVVTSRGDESEDGKTSHGDGSEDVVTSRGECGALTEGVTLGMIQSGESSTDDGVKLKMTENGESSSGEEITDENPPEPVYLHIIQA